MAVTRLLGFARAFERLRDAASHDELPAENAHAGQYRLADDRLAEPGDQALEHAAKTLLLAIKVDHAPGEHQPPGRGIDEQRMRTAEPLFPLGRTNLVLDQQILRLGVGNAQQRLGETHQYDPLAAREVVGVHEGVDATPFGALGAHLFDQWRGAFADALAFEIGEARPGNQIVEELLLIAVQVFVDPAAAFRRREGFMRFHGFAFARLSSAHPRTTLRVVRGWR